MTKKLADSNSQEEEYIPLWWVILEIGFDIVAVTVLVGVGYFFVCLLGKLIFAMFKIFPFFTLFVVLLSLYLLKIIIEAEIGEGEE